MVAFNKFNSFVENLAEKAVDLGADTLKIVLTNTAPTNANTVLGNITQLANANGYPTNGIQANQASSNQTNGVYKLVLNDVVFTANGGSIGPLRYAVLYDDTASSPADLLIGWYDYGSSITLADGETLTIDYDPTNGAITIT